MGCSEGLRGEENKEFSSEDDVEVIRRDRDVNSISNIVSPIQNSHPFISSSDQNESIINEISYNHFEMQAMEQVKMEEQKTISIYLIRIYFS